MWVYALPAIGREPVLIFIGIYSIIFYERLGASLAVMSFLIAVSRGLDILNDPIIAYYCDLTKTKKLGRRYPWMLGSFVGFCISLICYWMPPDVVGIEAWFGVFYIILLIFFSLYFIPYEAIAPEITYDQDKRQKLYAIQAFTEAVSALLMAFFPAILSVIIAGSMGCGDSNSCELDAQRVAFSIMAILLSIVFVIATFMMVCKIPPNLEEVVKTANFAPALLKMTKNWPFVMLLGPWILERVSEMIILTFMPFVLIYVIDPEQHCKEQGIDEDDSQCSPNLWLAIGIIAFFLCGTCATCVWHKLANKYGKYRMWVWGSGLAIIPFFGFLFLGQGSMVPFVILNIFGGATWGARFLNEAVLADSIEYEELITGRRAEAEFMMF